MQKIIFTLKILYAKINTNNNKRQNVINTICINQNTGLRVNANIFMSSGQTAVGS